MSYIKAVGITKDDKAFPIRQNGHRGCAFKVVYVFDKNWYDTNKHAKEDLEPSVALYDGKVILLLENEVLFGSVAKNSLNGPLAHWRG